MNNLLKYALESKFGKDANIEEVLEVINATGNATVAVEKMLGIYEEPNLPKEVVAKRYSNDGDVCTLESFNPFKGEVTFTSLKKKSEYRYFNRSKLHTALGYDKDQTLYVRKEHITKFPELFFESETAFKIALPGDKCDYNSFSIGELQEVEGAMSLSNWKND